MLFLQEPYSLHSWTCHPIRHTVAQMTLNSKHQLIFSTGRLIFGCVHANPGWAGLLHGSTLFERGNICCIAELGLLYCLACQLDLRAVAHGYP